MAIIKSFVSAISLYSKIPMPNLKYEEGDDRYALVFFPMVGAIILGVQYFVCLANSAYNLNKVAMAIIFMLIPVMLTGGLHIDGFMDVMDAIHSYGDHTKRLEILKDPHIGAFCVIKLLELVGIWLALLIITDIKYYPLIGLGFIVSRVLSAEALLNFKHAKNDGMLAYEKNHSSKKTCECFLGIWLAIVIFAGWHYFGAIIFVLGLISVACLIYYKYKSLRDFGGVTGDTAGCFLVMLETAWLLVVAVWSVMV